VLNAAPQAGPDTPVIYHESQLAWAFVHDPRPPHMASPLPRWSSKKTHKNRVCLTARHGACGARTCHPV